MKSSIPFLSILKDSIVGWSDVNRLSSAVLKRLGHRQPRSASFAVDSEDEYLAQLLIAVQRGDKPSYAELLAFCDQFIRVAACRAGAGSASFDAIIAHSLVSVHHARHTYDPARSFKRWLESITRHNLAQCHNGRVPRP